MTEFSRTEYDFNSRFIINDTTTDTTAYALLNAPSITDTLAINTEEDKPTEPGIIDFGTKFGKGEWEAPITLFATTLPKMSQLIQDLKEAFNPDLLELDSTYGENTTYGGYHPLDWTEDVGGTSRAFRIYMKSRETPKVATDPLSGLVRKSTLFLKARDPRKYLQTASTRTGAGTANNAGTYPTPVTITITASGTTSTSLEITNSTVGKTIYVTTALTVGQVLVIDTFAHSVKLNGTEKRSMISGSSDWWTLSSGNNTLALSNDTNVTIEFSWRSAWPL